MQKTYLRKTLIFISGNFFAFGNALGTRFRERVSGNCRGFNGSADQALVRCGLTNADAGVGIGSKGELRKFD